MLCTVTWGGARAGNCAMGRVGMDTAPARMIISAQTVAKMGRRMKKSANISPESRRSLLTVCASTGSQRPHRGAVPQELGAGDDDAVAGVDPLQHHVVVAHDLADLEGPLLRHQRALL